MTSTSLMHETDLVVSINDLEHLFNSDEDEVRGDLGARHSGYLLTECSLAGVCLCVRVCVSINCAPEQCLRSALHQLTTLTFHCY